MGKSVGFSVVLIVLAGTTALLAQGKDAPAKGEEKAKAELSIRVVGFQVSAPAYEDSYQMQPFEESGTCVALLIKSRTKKIVEFCEDKSKFLALKDNKGTNLQGGKSWREDIGEPEFGYPEISKDGKAVLFVVRGEGTPAAGSTRVKVQGIVRLLMATKLAKARQKNVLLQLDSEITVGPVPMKMSRLESGLSSEFPVRITLMATKSLAAVKAIRFYDEKGTEITSRYYSGGSSTSGGRKRVYKTFSLSRKVNKMAVEVEHWQDLEEQPVPFSLEVGLSLQ